VLSRASFNVFAPIYAASLKQSY